MLGDVNKRLLPYFNLLGEIELYITLYTLVVYMPLHLLLHWLPSIFTCSPNKQEYASIIPKDLDKMPTKTIIIKSAWFLLDM